MRQGYKMKGGEGGSEFFAVPHGFQLDSPCSGISPMNLESTGLYIDESPVDSSEFPSPIGLHLDFYHEKASGFQWIPVY